MQEHNDSNILSQLNTAFYTFPYTKGYTRLYKGTLDQLATWLQALARLTFPGSELI